MAPTRRSEDKTALSSTIPTKRKKTAKTFTYSMSKKDKQAAVTTAPPRCMILKMPPGLILPLVRPKEQATDCYQRS
ncbi:hypothetical protein E8E11_005200 [Didymella keratinophila]|nr:hypothetical protein E8E11_005200 [Didymella keratinophila]